METNEQGPNGEPASGGGTVGSRSRKESPEVTSEIDCIKHFTTRELRTYLYAIQAGHTGDPNIAGHLSEHCCTVCSERVTALRATEPFLRGEPSKSVAVYKRVVDADLEEHRLDVETGRERALEKLTRALLAVILGQVGPSQNEVDQLEAEFFNNPPAGMLREDLSQICRERHKEIPKVMQEKVRGLWAFVVDELSAGKPEAILTGLRSEEAAAFRVWALGEEWMLAASRPPWSENRNEGRIDLIIERQAVVNAVECAKELRLGAKVLFER